MSTVKDLIVPHEMRFEKVALFNEQVDVVVTVGTKGEFKIKIKPNY